MGLELRQHQQYIPYVHEAVSPYCQCAWLCRKHSVPGRGKYFENSIDVIGGKCTVHHLGATAATLIQVDCYCFI